MVSRAMTESAVAATVDRTPDARALPESQEPAMTPDGLKTLSKRYLTALRSHVRRRSKKAPPTAQGFGRVALLLGLETLDLARVHEQALLALDGALAPAKSRRALAKHAETFFLEAMTPIERTHRAARESRRRSRKLDGALTERLAVLAATRHRLNDETNKRKTAEHDLAKGARTHDLLLTQSRRMQEQMRNLARQVLLAQEEERREISRELHDEIAQTLAGINVQLAGLKVAAALNNRGLNRKIAATQRLVTQSVRSVHQFARYLRPALLDDLGLIPALRSYMKALPGRNGLQIQFTAFVGVEALESIKRIVIYRVAQEALTNVARHARASIALVEIRKVPGGILLEVTDDGRSFRPDRIFASKAKGRLGLLGMRERVEMVGGSLSIISARGKGTIVRAEIPFHRKAAA